MTAKIAAFLFGGSMKRNELPLFCFTTLQETGELVLVKQYEKGYFKTDYDVGNRRKIWK